MFATFGHSSCSGISFYFVDTLSGVYFLFWGIFFILPLNKPTLSEHDVFCYAGLNNYNLGLPMSQAYREECVGLIAWRRSGTINALLCQLLYEHQNCFVFCLRL